MEIKICSIAHKVPWKINTRTLELFKAELYQAREIDSFRGKTSDRSSRRRIGVNVDRIRRPVEISPVFDAGPWHQEARR